MTTKMNTRKKVVGGNRWTLDTHLKNSMHFIKQTVNVINIIASLISINGTNIFMPQSILTEVTLNSEEV